MARGTDSGAVRGRPKSDTAAGKGARAQARPGPMDALAHSVADTGADPASEPSPARVVQKKEFVERVIAASGASRATARPIIEIVLDQLGRAFAAGETLAIPPFGKARISRHKDVRGSEVITLRLRRKPVDGHGGDHD